MGLEDIPTMAEIAPTVSATSSTENTNPEKGDSLEQAPPPSAPEAGAKNKKRAHQLDEDKQVLELKQHHWQQQHPPEQQQQEMVARRKQRIEIR